MKLTETMNNIKTKWISSYSTKSHWNSRWIRSVVKQLITLHEEFTHAGNIPDTLFAHCVVKIIWIYAHTINRDLLYYMYRYKRNSELLKKRIAMDQWKSFQFFVHGVSMRNFSAFISSDIFSASYRYFEFRVTADIIISSLIMNCVRSFVSMLIEMCVW